MHGRMMVARDAGKRHLPGEVGIWLFSLGDMLMFSLFFVTYLYYRGQEPALFDASQAHLNLHFGVVNTLLLLTSSWFVVMGVDAVRSERMTRAKNLFRIACLCGAGFVALKVAEYTQKSREGFNLLTDNFFMFYYMYTGIHLIHVLLGLVFLAWLVRKCRTATSADIATFEIGASFWHLVDLLWIMLFPLLYLVK